MRSNKKENIESKSGQNFSETDKFFYESYQSHAAAVRAYCKCMVRDILQSEDIFQETFISFYEKLQAGVKILEPVAYLIGIAKNIILRYNRDKKPTVEIDFEQFVCDETRKYEKDELMNILINSLDLLDDIYREVFVLREFDGLHFNEIAELCGINISNAKIRYYRAQKELIRILNPYLKDLNR